MHAMLSMFDPPVAALRHVVHFWFYGYDVMFAHGCQATRKMRITQSDSAGGGTV